MHRWRWVVRSAVLVAPALVLGVSGAAKVVSPDGATPRVLRPLADAVPYEHLLRALGVLELLVAAALCAPRCRAAACTAGLFLFAALTVFAALNAHDAEFLRNCGCFGGLTPAAASGPMASLALLALRNAVIAGMLALPILEKRFGDGHARTALTGSIAAALGLLITALYLGESMLRRETERVLDAVHTGHERQEERGWTFPDLEVTDREGRRKRTADVLRAGDHLLCFSPSCPHCRRMAPAWARFARSLPAGAKRVILVAVDGAAAVDEFVRATECSDLDCYVLDDPLDGLRLGVDAVPSLLVLGPEHRVEFAESGPRPPSFIAALESLNARSSGLSGDLERRAAELAAGELRTCARDATAAGGLVFLTATTAGGAARRVILGSAPRGICPDLEVAIAFDEDARIAGIAPITISGYPAVVDPSLASAQVLVGKHVDDAAAIARRLGAEADVRAPLQGTLAEILRAASATLQAR